MDRKEARVCVTCHSALTSGEYHCKLKVSSFQHYVLLYVRSECIHATEESAPLKDFSFIILRRERVNLEMYEKLSLTYSMTLSLDRN